MCGCEQADVVDHTERKARKVHRCSECDEHIVSGERYTVVSQLFDGSWDSWKLCASCKLWWQEFWRWQRSSGACYCIEIGAFADTLSEIQEEMEAVARDRERLAQRRLNGLFVMTDARGQ